MRVLLDTNALPRSRHLDNVILSALFRIARERGYQICIPSIVAHESVSDRRHRAEDAISELRSALKKAWRVLMDVEPLYLPDAAEVASSWEAELFSRFHVVDAEDEDATEALRREALRIPPCSGGSGGRDALVWLTAKRCHLAAGGETHLVSDDPGAFRDSQGGLKRELVNELGDAAGSFYWHHDIDSFIGAVASRVEGEVADASALESLTELWDELIGGGALESVRSIWELELEPSPADLTFRIKDVETLRAYDVDGVVLALLEIDFAVEADEEVSQAGLEALECGARLWATFRGGDSRPDSVEIQSITGCSPSEFQAGAG